MKKENRPLVGRLDDLAQVAARRRRIALCAPGLRPAKNNSADA